MALAVDNIPQTSITIIILWVVFYLEVVRLLRDTHKIRESWILGYPTYSRRLLEVPRPSHSRPRPLPPDLRQRHNLPFLNRH